LTEPEANLIEQHKCLLAAEGVELVIADNVIKRIAELAAEANKNVENIGARRLYTVMERVRLPLFYDRLRFLAQLVFAETARVFVVCRS